MKRPRRRAILKMLMLLLAGATLNVAVAWGCAVGIDVYDDHRILGSVIDFRVVVDRCAGAMHVYSTRFTPFHATQQRRGPDPATIEPAWLRFDAPLPESGLISINRVGDARGWPMLSMWSEQPKGQYQEAPNHLVTAPVFGGIKTSLSPWFMPGGVASAPRILPLRLIWPGFAINTLFYAAMLWMLFAVPFALRRMIRRRRGRCAHCAYPIGISEVCTECGTSVMPAKAGIQRAHG